MFLFSIDVACHDPVMLNLQPRTGKICLGGLNLACWSCERRRAQSTVFSRSCGILGGKIRRLFSERMDCQLAPRLPRCLD